MSDLTAGLLGAIAGLIVALLGNIIVLPYVLRQQERRLPGSYRAPVTGWDKQKVASLTKLLYRFQMPIFFAVIGAIFVMQMFGDAG
jgi:hypothetical protein